MSAGKKKSRIDYMPRFSVGQQVRLNLSAADSQSRHNGQVGTIRNASPLHTGSEQAIYGIVMPGEKLVVGAYESELELVSTPLEQFPNAPEHKAKDLIREPKVQPTPSPALAEYLTPANEEPVSVEQYVQHCTDTDLIEEIRRRGCMPAPQRPETTLQDVVDALNEDMKLWNKLVQLAPLAPMENEVDRRNRVSGAESERDYALAQIMIYQEKAEQAQAVIDSKGVTTNG